MKMNSSLCTTVCALLFLCLGASGCVAQKVEQDLPNPEFTSLSDLTDQFAHDLAATIETREKRTVYLDRANIREAKTRDVANFSIYLENELDASLSAAFRLVNNPRQAEYLVGAVFQSDRKRMRLFFKYHTNDMSQRKSMDYAIQLHYLPKDALQENLRSKAHKIAANVIGGEDEAKIYVNSPRMGSCNCVTEFSRVFASMLRSELRRLYPYLEICTEKPIPVRSAVAIARNMNTAELQNSDAAFAGADTVLDGEYFLNGDTVMVNTFLKDLRGSVLSSSDIDIDRHLIMMPLTDPKNEDLIDIADRKEEKNAGLLKVSTTKGSNAPLYYAGEKIHFLIQTGQPLYIYIYNITSDKEGKLLYPREGTGLAYHRPLRPGMLQTLPSENDTYVLEAEPPFGTDLVKVFASPMALPLPVLTSG